VPVSSDVLPARLVLSDGPLQSLLLADNAEWADAIEDAAAKREDLLPHLDALVRRHSVESSVRTWTSAVGLGVRS
jgi:hypothetical protein